MLRILCGIALVIVTTSAFPNLQERAETCTTDADCPNDTCHGHAGGNVICAIHHGDTGVCHCEHHHHTQHPHPAVRAETCTTDADCPNDTCHGHAGGNVICAIHHGDTGVCHCEHHHHTQHPHPAVRAETCTTDADCPNDTCHGHAGGNVICAIHHGDTGVCHCEHHHHTQHPHPAVRAETCTTDADCPNDTCHGHAGGNVICAIHHGDTGVCHCEHHHHTQHPHPAVRAETCTTDADCPNDTCHGHAGGNVICAIHHGDTGVCHCEHHHHTQHPHPAVRAETCTTDADCPNDTCHGHAGGNVICAIHHGDTGVCHCEHHHHTQHPHPAVRAESCTTDADCPNDTCHDHPGNVICAIHHGSTGVCHCEHHHHTPHPHPAVRNDKCFNDTDCSQATCHGHDGIVTCEIHHEGHEGICHCTHTQKSWEDEEDVQ
ncbi:histidine-rich glycoprotein-like [Saccostrea echinata]|uniref:histidine-rich glycoprotein-like n=1 Tax=Saccostrea echinata TaxID=191078 RepID=UPI002A809244|nr:histidine-rich glycoprotein-like [Saccostrea echinata]